MSVRPKPTDVDLLRAARGGSSAAFEALVERYEGRLFRFLRMRAGSREDAEDLLQETFARCWHGLASFDEARPFSAWAYRIAANLAISRRRRTAPASAAGDLADSADRRPGPADAVAGRDAKDNLWELAARVLQPEPRSALWQNAYAEDRSAAEVGEILGKREGTVRVMLMRARERLSQAMRGVVALEER